MPLDPKLRHLGTSRHIHLLHAYRCPYTISYAFFRQSEYNTHVGDYICWTRCNDMRASLHIFHQMSILFQYSFKPMLIGVKLL